MEGRWPAHFPDGCPPNDASSPDQLAFRVVATNSPTKDDFITLAERRIKEGKQSSPRDYCKACALSVFPSREGAQHMISAFPFIGNHVSHGALSTAHGKIKRTGGLRPDHQSWWVYSRVSPHEFFSVLSETG